MSLLTIINKDQFVLLNVIISGTHSILDCFLFLGWRFKNYALVILRL